MRFIASDPRIDEEEYPMAVTAMKSERHSRTKVQIVDCDIHNTLPSPQALIPFLPERWRAHYERFGRRGFAGGAYPKANPNAARTDSWPPSGRPPGSDLSFLREQLLDAWDISYGVLNNTTPIRETNPDYGFALSHAINDWQVAGWLDPEPRLRASIVVHGENAEMAAAEIEQRAADPRFVQVILVVRTSEPLGRRKYWKMYEAASRHNLPIGIHFGGGVAGNPTTGAGWPSYYIEDHTGMAQAFQSQVISYVCEGVFEAFPTLKVVLIEGGFAWLPPLMWRLDTSVKRLREEVPHLKRLPSEYIREHFWTTTQPMEEPGKPEYFHELLEQMDMDDHLMFATDYPHWDFDAPDQALPVKLPPERTAKIMSGNAHALYRFNSAL